MAEVGKMTRKRRPSTAAQQGGRRKTRRRGSRMLYYILIAVFLISAGIALSFTVFFKTETIDVTGQDKYPAEDIVVSSGIIKGENLFRIDSEAVTQRLLEQYPYIESVKVRRILPHEARLDIALCTPAGALVLGDEYILITREGKVLERGLIFIPEGVPLIKGVDAGYVEPGEWLGMSHEEEAEAEQRVKSLTSLLSKETDGKNETVEENREGLEKEKESLERRIERSKSVLEAMRMLDYLFIAMEETGFKDITNVDITDQYNMKIIFENRLLLNLGTESELPAKLTFLKEMIENRLPPDAEGLIDAANIDKRSVILSPMTIEEAVEGKKKSRANPGAGLKDNRQPEQEDKQDETGEVSQESRSDENNEETDDASSE